MFFFVKIIQKRGRVNGYMVVLYTNCYEEGYNPLKFMN